MKSTTPHRPCSPIHLHVRPAPCLDPPFDDQRCHRPRDMDMLPLPESSAPGNPQDGRRHPFHRPLVRRTTTTAWEATPRLGREEPHSGHAAVRRFASICSEVINGYRPISHLRPLTRPARLSDVTEQLLRCTKGTQRSASGRQNIKIRRIRVFEPVPGVAEAAIVLDYGGWCLAMAVRMERTQHGWQCCVLHAVL